MKKILAFFILLISASEFSAAQYTIQGNDTTFCLSSGGTLYAVPDTTTGLSILTLPDDTYSHTIDIGFPFNFYGNTYTKCLISTNGYITFDTTLAWGFSYFTVHHSIPFDSIGTPKNAIMGPWVDINPDYTPFGEMSYGIFGNAPNRRFVANYCSVPSYYCNLQLNTFQIILYEGTNVIEMHITEKNTCLAWNQGHSIQGLHNATGTLAAVVPGRNYPSVWSATNDARRFTPNGSFTNYTIDSIPFVASTMIGTPVWMRDTVVIGHGEYVYVHPTQTTTYHLITTGCGSSDDSVTVYVSSFDTSSVVSNATCPNPGNGFIIFDCIGDAPFLFSWEDSLHNVIQTTTGSNGSDTLNGLGSGNYFLSVSDSGGCTNSGSYLPYGFSITSPPSFMLTDTSVNASCFVCSDGSADVNISGGTPPYHYLWSSGETTDSIAGKLPGTYVLTITDSAGCSLVDTLEIGFNISVHDVTIDNSFTLYPNPTSGQLIIDNGQLIINEIQITDMIGRKLKEIKTELNSEKEIIDLRNFPNGIYFLTIKNNDGVSRVKKFVVQR